ncbi:MAG: AtpZ/AtpI family protein [Bacteroidales bacterium]|nr:AtpZ/AtpI family protein [Bacteroidales bacterium]
MKNDKIKQSKKYYDSYVRYSSIAIQMAVIIILGIFGGTYIDEWLVLRFPVFTIVLSLISVSAAIYLAVKDLLKK